MPEVRPIDANALKKDLSEFNYDMALRIVDTQPKIEAEPVRHGRWILNCDENIVCSQCRHPQQIGAKDFCGKCGARMDATDTNDGGKGGANNDT